MTWTSHPAVLTSQQQLAMGVTQYVKVEFVSGPLDGEIRILPTPTPIMDNDFYIPMRSLMSMGLLQPSAPSTMRQGRYRPDERQDFELVSLLSGDPHVAAALEGRKTFVMVWQGEDAK